MNVAIILSGGKGLRMKSKIPKQYLRAGERMIVTDTLSRIAGVPEIGLIQIVADESWRRDIEEDFSAAVLSGLFEKLNGFSRPGETRQLSILNALRDIRGKIADEDIVLIHDAVRPSVSEEQLRLCLVLAEGSDGAMPVLPMKDTVYLSEDGKKVTGLLDRSKVYAGQAPEAFKYGKYLHAVESLLPDRIRAINGSSEPALLSGMNISIFEGDESNFKITTLSDLERYKNL